MSNFGLRVTETRKGLVHRYASRQWQADSARRRRVSHRHRMWQRVVFTQARDNARAALADMDAGIDPKRRVEIKQRKKRSCV